MTKEELYKLQPWRHQVDIDVANGDIVEVELPNGTLVRMPKCLAPQLEFMVAVINEASK